MLTEKYLLNRLLLRQLKKYKVTIDDNNTTQIELLNAISKSYEHYESSRVLIERAMELSNLELQVANKKLYEEIENTTLNLDELKALVQNTLEISNYFINDIKEGKTKNDL